uniref:F-box domain-containing protein n=1 Tax=Takifugu rubripes TaxID=31033 RepID=H2U572_TAKRU
MDKSVTAVPHSVKRWQLSGTDYDPETVRTLRSFLLLCVIQLFEDRVKLVIRWFDLWTDGQRKHLMSSLLGRCTSSQLRDLLMETVPVTRLDFTTVLPRFLSLYVLSFLNPRDLCAAAQVSWQWRFLAEQDCLWTKRCVRRGWFLPYSPGTREYGAWKNHYIDCVSTLHWLPPRKAATHYRSLHQRAGETAVEEERRQGRKESCIGAASSETGPPGPWRHGGSRPPSQ